MQMSGGSVDAPAYSFLARIGCFTHCGNANRWNYKTTILQTMVQGFTARAQGECTYIAPALAHSKIITSNIFLCRKLKHMLTINCICRMFVCGMHSPHAV